MAFNYTHSTHITINNTETDRTKEIQTQSYAHTILCTGPIPTFLLRNSMHRCSRASPRRCTSLCRPGCVAAECAGMSAMEARTHSIASNTEHTRDHIHSRVADSNKQVGDFTPPLQRSPGFILATCQRAVAQDASLRVLGPGKHVERLIYIRIPQCILLKKE